MAFVNEHYLKLAGGYLFPEIARRIDAYKSSCPPDAPPLIHCGIGDVTEPLPAAAVEAVPSTTPATVGLCGERIVGESPIAVTIDMGSSNASESSLDNLLHLWHDATPVAEDPGHDQPPGSTCPPGERGGEGAAHRG